MRFGKYSLILAGASVALLGLYAAGLTPALRKRANALHPKTGKPILLPGKEGDGTLLHNGWRITPAGRSLPAGDMLLGGAFSPDGKTLAIPNCGFGAHALNLVDIETEKSVAKIRLTRAWNGIAWAPDGKRLYLSGGPSNPTDDIYSIEKTEDGWKQGDGLKLAGNDPKQTCIAGLALSFDGKTLFALNNSDNRLYVLNIADEKVLARLEVGDHPIVCKLTPDGKSLYVANWGGSEVALLDVSDPAHPSVVTRLTTGAHPNDLALSTDDRLFVSCGNDDAVTVYDTRTRKPLETIKTTLTPKSPSGSTPCALALTPDNKTLYVANADNNAVCVIDVAARGKSRVAGFLPTGWYPSAVLVSADGKKVIVGSGKGTGTQPNPTNPKIPFKFPLNFQYIGAQLNGLLSFVDAPNAAQLASYTQQVYANTPYKDAQLRTAQSDRKTAIPTKVGAASPIKYVLYIIKENRTYDQVFGDVPKGNGDPKLVLFGQNVTPNHHALAEQYVLLDNLYCNGEVSEDGHPWSTSAIANDFTQRTWVLSYSGKGRLNRTEPIGDPKAGYIWEACRRKGLTFRSYGEYQGHSTLAGHESAHYIGKVRPGEAPPGRDTDRADIFISEFQEFEKTNSIPRFMVMSLGEDHTRGTTLGAFTPEAAVASNDQALGKIVETISHSRVWKEFAIFVIEDDAQNGPDHIDSHRTVGFVISPYTRRGYVDSEMYTTASMLRTMELILGLPPLTQYDASATPMFASFTDTPDTTPYTLVAPRMDLNAKNTAMAYGAKESGKMDWSEYDRIDEDKLNRILWHSIKGRNTPMPPPVRRALASATGKLHTPSATRDNDD